MLKKLIILIVLYALIVFGLKAGNVCPEYNNKMPGPGKSVTKQILTTVFCPFSSSVY